MRENFALTVLQKRIQEKNPKKKSFFAFLRMPKTKAFERSHFATLCSQKLHTTGVQAKFDFPNYL
jgi:hypothetical protein